MYPCERNSRVETNMDLTYLMGQQNRRLFNQLVDFDWDITVRDAMSGERQNVQVKDSPAGRRFTVINNDTVP